VGVQGAGGGLSPDAPDAATELEWLHDPDDLVPSSVPNAFAFLLFQPDEAALGARADVLSFTTDLFDRDVDLAGPVRVAASVSSDGPAMDVFARLLDLAPDGTALRIARGQVHVTDAGDPAAVDIDLGQVGYRVRAGHRLRLHVHSSDFPEFLPQPGTGEEPWGAVATEVNRQRVVLGGDEPLRLTVTVLPDTRAEEARP
jgi:putative CocE/NonD family hydrolase